MWPLINTAVQKRLLNLSILIGDGHYAYSDSLPWYASVLLSDLPLLSTMINQ